MASHSVWAELLALLKRPVRIWQGADDDNIPLDAVRWMADQLPSSELTVLPATDHDVSAAFPDAFGWLAGSLR